MKKFLIELDERQIELIRDSISDTIESLQKKDPISSVMAGYAKLKIEQGERIKNLMTKYIEWPDK